MGWQKRSSGKVYNSPTGHALLFGAKTKKVLNFTVLSKLCSTCDGMTKEEIAAAMNFENGDNSDDLPVLGDTNTAMNCKDGDGSNNTSALGENVATMSSEDCDGSDDASVLDDMNVIFTKKNGNL